MGEDSRDSRQVPEFLCVSPKFQTLVVRAHRSSATEGWIRGQKSCTRRWNVGDPREAEEPQKTRSLQGRVEEDAKP